MKKILALLLAALMVVSVLSLASCGNNDTPDDTGADSDTTADTSKDESDDLSDSGYKVAMVTDYGDITDQSFNQTTYEACIAFCEDHNLEFEYFKPAADSTADRVTSIESAIDKGYNVIVLPGYAFAGALVETAPSYTDVKFIALDVAKGDLLGEAVPKKGETYDFDPDNWELEDYVDLSNVYCAIYQEELCGYMAGYAAVKLGYEKLGFLGGMAVPAVIRYGYGFVQGADAAAEELGKKIEINYAYGNQFYGDADITARMDTWYQGGTEVVFACGGGIYSSAGEAAAKIDGKKVIGVDVDQKGIIDGKYGEGMTVTSAMKGLYNTTYETLKDVLVNDNWDNYKGKIETLGLINGENPEANYVQIPMESTQWSESFTKDDYKELVKAMFDGTITVSADTTALPAVTNTTVNDQGNIK